MLSTAETPNKLQTKYNELESVQVNLHKIHGELKQQNHNLDKQLALITQEKQQLTNKIKNSENLITQLQHENQFLTQEKTTLTQQLKALECQT